MKIELSKESLAIVLEHKKEKSPHEFVNEIIVKSFEKQEPLQPMTKQRVRHKKAKKLSLQEVEMCKKLVFVDGRTMSDAARLFDVSSNQVAEKIGWRTHQRIKTSE